MKRSNTNNIFKNPEGWAGGVVRTLWHYRFSQIFTLFGGVIIFLNSVSESKPRDLMDYLFVAVVISAFSIATPLMYLRALRYLYLETQHLEGNQQSGGADRG